MNAPAPSTPTADPPDLEERDQRLPDIIQRRATLVAALVIGVVVLTIAGAVSFSGSFDESAGIESSVISDEPPTAIVMRGMNYPIDVVFIWSAETERFETSERTKPL